MKAKYLILATIAGAIVTLDQATKMYIHTQFRLGESVDVIANYFNITYVRNYGAAFGILADSHPEFREIFFLSMPPIAMIIIFFLLKSVSNKDHLQILALSSVFGGAIGNYIDRVRFRYVIDFLDFHYQKTYSWPAFNVADIAIVTGVSTLFLLTIVPRPEFEPVGGGGSSKKSDDDSSTTSSSDSGSSDSSSTPQGSGA